MARRSTSLIVLAAGGLVLAAVYGSTRFYTPDTHCGEDRAFLPARAAPLGDTETARFPVAPPPPCARNRSGETESIGRVSVTHWFVEASGVTWHFVTTDPEPLESARPPVVLLHGFPESWWAFHHQIEALAVAGWRTIAIDVPPYGQSDKRPEVDYRYPALAAGVLALLDRIGVGHFALVAHDRGCVIADHLIAQPGADGRVERYVRIQESVDRTHDDPGPPHRLMGSAAGTVLYRSRRFPTMVYQGQLVARPLPKAEIERLDYEFKYLGIADAAPLSFRTTSLDQELADRRDRLFASMTMPVLFLQGRLDPSQPPDEYFRAGEVVVQGRLQFIEAGHFPQLEAPELVSASILAFLDGDAAPAPESAQSR